MTKSTKIKEEVIKYAVIRINGRQYIVEEGKELLIDKINPKDIKPEVLLVVDPTSPRLRGASGVEVGKPVLKNVKVKIKVVTEIEKGKKLRIFKYKAKSRYRKRIGFRPKHTRILIEKVSTTK